MKINRLCKNKVEKLRLFMVLSIYYPTFRIIYDHETLSDLMRENGFKDICPSEISKSKHPELNNIEGHFKYMPFDYYELETMIVEASNDK